MDKDISRLDDGSDLCVVGSKRFKAGELAVLELEYPVGQIPMGRGSHLWLLADIRQVPDSFQATDPDRPGCVRAWATGGQSLRVTCPGETRPGDLVRTLDLLPAIPEFLFVVEILVEDRPLGPGDAIRFQLGGDVGWAVPRHSIDEFHLWAIPDAEGKWQFEPTDEKYHSFIPVDDKQTLPKPAQATISVLPGSPARLDVVIPSDHRPKASIPMQIRWFDRFENPYSVQLSTVHTIQALVEGAEGNSLNITVSEEGAHDTLRIEVTEPTSGLKDISNPSRVESAPGTEHIHWGILHGMFFNQRPLDYYFEYARDIAALDFCAGQHFSYEAALPGVWNRTRETVSRYYDPGKFVTFLGVECDPGPCGHKIILYRDTEVPPLLAERRPAVRLGAFLRRELDPDTIHCNTVEELWQALHALGEGRAMVTAHHTADWGYHDPALQRLAEIYSKWGTCEYPGNPLDLRPANPPREYVQEPLKRGYHLGMIAGGDTHDSRPGNQAPEPFGLEFPDGLTAVFATSLTREAIWEALWQRRTYGTTGARILLHFEVNDTPMGGEVGQEGPVEIKIEAVGTAPIQSIELIRDNQAIRRWQKCGEQVRLEYADETLPSGRGHFYYVRLTQIDGQMAWSSPVWTITMPQE